VQQKYLYGDHEGANCKVVRPFCLNQVWLEYIFGICKPDGSIGKSGSRSVAFQQGPEC
jgi:hypothetical protein